MTYEVLGAGALDYMPCRYGTSKILFRGPERRLDSPYIAFLGGTETYGKFIKTPFPALVESTIGVNCVNFGIPNAGVDVFASDKFVVDAASQSVATILQIVGAQNLSNRFYTVHPRRNDRFVSASASLKAIFPEVDFSEFHFNRHMLSCLHTASKERFAAVRDELQSAWSARMKLLVKQIQSKVILVWFADHIPLHNEPVGLDPALSHEPLFVTREMLDDLAVHADGLVEITASQEAMNAGTEGMVFSEMESLVARAMMGPQAHGEAAARVGAELQSLV